MRLFALTFVTVSLAACTIESTPAPAPSGTSSSSSGGTQTGNGDTTGTGDTTDTKTGSADSSGVSPTKTLDSLSATEKGKLCDWTASLQGGYGKSTSCGDGVTVKTKKDQAACVSSLPASCTAKVSDVEACMKVDAKDPCALAVMSADECAPLRDCMQ